MSAQDLIISANMQSLPDISVSATVHLSRQSILNRPKRPASRITETNAEREYEREQSRLAAARHRKMMVEEGFRVHAHGSVEEKKLMQYVG